MRFYIEDEMITEGDFEYAELVSEHSAYWETNSLSVYYCGNCQNELPKGTYHSEDCEFLIAMW